ncbi:hypothetical protein SEA_ZOOMAN_324 [Microbacterium phage Zooman]|nr:hypothetical protein SEA_ZOOMAN_11 [Microbacterium phage Zooman]UDL16565.1 hypothetical protein SEA_ZOOMAN_324 [Microbacterium phage Zooman]
MQITFQDGVTREVDGIDINVWNENDGSMPGLPDKVHVTGYPMTQDALGLFTTDAGTTVFDVETNLPGEDWDSDWFHWDSELMPADVRRVVDSVLKEIS